MTDTQEQDNDGETLEARAPSPAPDGRLDAWLAGVWSTLSRARIQGLIGAGKISVDGAPVAAAKDKIRPGGLYRALLPPPEPAAPLAEAIPLNVVHEDAHLIVVDKPAGMAAHPAPGSMRGTLVNALLHHCGDTLSGINGVARPGIVHRIDKDTTGLIVAAKSDVAHRGLAKLFAKHNLERAYYAVVRGAPAQRSGALSTRIARSDDDRRKYCVVRNEASEAGKHAVTHYWTVETYGQLRGASIGRPAASLMECRLETGRTHQIRVHLAHLGAPIIGDGLYGRSGDLRADGAHAADADAAVRGFARQALHAAVLGFVHPVTGESLRFESKPPADMQALMASLRAL